MHVRSRRFPLAPLGLTVLLALTAAGCGQPLPEVTPDQIPTLEQQLSSSPDDADVQTRLGIAYYKAERYDDARATLSAAVEDGATSGAVHLYLGLAHEELENWGEARQAYSSYLDSGASGPLREDIQARLSFIVQRELMTEARQALAREAELTDEAPEPRSVAVFPFRLVTERQELQPLSVALADMMITDLSLAGGLTVLERGRIQALLNEMALSEAGYTEASTGARAGRLLRAEHVVQGAVTTLGGDELEMTTQVRHTVRRESQGQVSARESLQQLFDLEKQTVFEVLDVLGVDLTPAEREAINENRTENIQAFLAYGRGLQAMDRGDYSAAMSQFNEAVQLDPAFDRAQSQVQEASQVQQGASVSTQQIADEAVATAGTVSQPPDADQTSIAQATDNLLQQTANETNPNKGQTLTDQGNPQSGTDQQSTDRNPTQEARNADEVSSDPTGTITITVGPPPGGSGGGGEGGDR